MEETMSKEDKIRMQTKLRAKKHYDANKLKINEIRRQKHLLQKSNGEVTEIIKPIETETNSDEETDNNKPLTKNDILLYKLTELNLNANTLKKYQYDFKRLMTIIDNASLIEYLRNGNELIEKIKGCDYANNTKRGLIQICLFMITKYQLKINQKSVKQLTAYFELLKEQTNTEAEKKKETEQVLSWAEYLDKVKTEFGENSKMYLIARLYNELTLRDDFVLKIKNDKPKTTDENYIVLKDKNYIVIINQYKTQAKYGKIEVKLKAPLTKLIAEYIKLQNLKEDDYLLGEKELSSFIIYNNKKIGVNGGVSMYRQMTITNSYSNLSEEEKIKLAEEMKHSPLIQKKYLRNLGNKIV